MKFWSLVRKELLVLGRDVHGLLVLFVMPAVFILIMSLAMRDGFNSERAVSVDFLLQNQSAERLGARLSEELKQVEGFRAVPVDAAVAADELRRQVAEDEYKFALLVPPDFGARLKDWGGEAAEPVTVLMSPAVAPQSRLLFEIAVNQTLRKLQLENFVFPSLGLMSLGQEQLLLPAANLAGEYVFRDGAERVTPTAVQQSVPAWLVFAMFFVVIPLSTAFLVEREEGTLVRLQMMNVSPATLILAKVAPYYLVNQIQMVLMVAVGMYLVPRLGGDALNPPDSWLGLWLVSSATSLAAIGFALLISTLVRSSIEATTLGGVSNIILGALGGVMVPKFVMPKFMQDVVTISPMSWGLEGFLDVFLRGGAWGEVVPEAGALLLFGAGCLAGASLLFQRRLRGLA